MRQIDGAALHVVHQTARGRDYDIRVLSERFELALETRPKVTLKEVIDAYPIEKGLFELLAYMEIAKSEACHFTPAKERIFFQGIDGRSRYVTMERIVFEKKEP